MRSEKYLVKEDPKSDYETEMTLTVRNWTRADENHYLCISTNSLGKADGRIQAYSSEFIGERLQKECIKLQIRSHSVAPGTSSGANADRLLVRR